MVCVECGLVLRSDGLRCLGGLMGSDGGCGYEKGAPKGQAAALMPICGCRVHKEVCSFDHGRGVCLAFCPF